MLSQKNFFMYAPGNENETGELSSNVSDDLEAGEQQSSDLKEKPSFLKKIKDALQDWSNNDQREQQLDDTRP